MSTLKTTTLTALVLATGLVLSACSNPPATTPTPDVTETVVAEPTIEPTIEVVEPVEVGAVTDAALVEACQPGVGLGIINYGDEAGQCPLATTQRIYTTADGTTWMVDKTLPLPEQVMGEVVALTAATVVTTGADVAAHNTRAAEVAAVVDQVGASTGKQVVIIDQMDNLGTSAYVARTGRSFVTQGNYPTAQEAYDAAAAIIAGYGNANEYVLVPYSG